MPVTVSRTSNMQALNLRLKALEHMECYVGIPQENNSRPGEDLSNSELLFLQEHGSPINNIPPRPVLKPAIQQNQKMIAAQISRAAKAVLAGDEQKANAELQKTGIMAANAVKRFIADPANGLARNAPSTIRAKGSDIPLIDSGELRKSVSYTVQPIENLPKDRWKKSELGSGGKFGSETDTPMPEIAKKVAKATGAVEKTVEGIAEAGETLGEVAIL